jgi:hypothetical protein
MSSLREDLEQIRIILEDADMTGWVNSAGRRMTDILQAGDAFLFLPGGEEGAQWREIFPDETVLVVPPPHVSPPALRAKRTLHAVALRLGDLHVTGTAHLRPGEQDDPVLRATRRFLPLTDASYARDGEAEQTAEVVIVNLRRVSEFQAT